MTQKKSEMETCFPEVSVIVITYNQDLKRLFKTLDSIIRQEGISFEILVCDDGSDIRFEKELDQYFFSKHFDDYALFFHDHNEGTVSNYYSGLTKARGKYSKLLSPGDYFAGRDTLSRWVQHVKDNNAEWSFSDAYYYQIENGIQTFIRVEARPQITRPYIVQDKATCIWNYTALGDAALGAALIGKTQTQMRFCRTIREKGIKYCEDHIYRLMMFYGIVGCYFPVAAICYEYGTGISTSGSQKWRVRLLEDGMKTMQIILDVKDKSKLQKKIVKVLIRRRKPGKLGKIGIRGKLLLWMKLRFHPRLTPIPEDGRTMVTESESA